LPECRRTRRFHRRAANPLHYAALRAQHSLVRDGARDRESGWSPAAGSRCPSRLPRTDLVADELFSDSERKSSVRRRDRVGPAVLADRDPYRKRGGDRDCEHSRRPLGGELARRRPERLHLTAVACHSQIMPARPRAGAVGTAWSPAPAATRAPARAGRSRGGGPRAKSRPRRPPRGRSSSRGWRAPSSRPRT
jgi:hypothetical protein